MFASIEPAATSLDSARHVLVTTLGQEAGSLSPGGVLSQLPSNEVWEVRLRVEAAQWPLDAANDYSFLETRQAGQGTGPVVVRYVEPNPHITATLDGRQLWGLPPTATAVRGENLVTSPLFFFPN